MEVLFIKEEIKKMVEENHNLIYSYCYKNNLSIDDYYGVLAETLCRVCEKFNKDRGSLSTFIYKSFDNVIKNERRKVLSAKRNSVVLDIDDFTNIKADFNVERKCLFNELLEKFGNNIVKLYIQGYTQKEIAEMLDLNVMQVSRSLAKFRISVKNYLRE